MGLILPGLGVANAQDSSVLEIFPEDISCIEASFYCQKLIPYFMYNDEPDSLVMAINFWETNCGSAEPIRRFRILASIWDGAFSEDIYDSRLIDDLAWRFDPARLQAQGKEGYADLKASNVASVIDFYHGSPDFDIFTEDLANQLLPHIPAGTVEQFFCLFYSGQTEPAYALLNSETLEGSELHRRYHAELSSLVIPDFKNFGGLSSSIWRPTGRLSAVGNHATVGAFTGRRWHHWMSKVQFSLRLGRSAKPYQVITDDFQGRSNRYGGFGIMLEGGRTIRHWGRSRFDLLTALGLEALNPFKDEEDIALINFHAFLGAGMHFDLGAEETWFAEVDCRREWISDPHLEGTNLGGQAWSTRLSLGFYIKHKNEFKLERLSR